MIRVLLTAVGIVLWLANPGWAQSTATSSTTSTGSFASLSPGNQKIAKALFSAQKTTGTTLTPLTKNQIADLKGTEGWGKVFQEMKADGLIQARNLGQVVSGRASTTSTTGRSASTTSTTNRGESTTTATSAGTRSSAGSTMRSTVSNIGAPNARSSAAGSSAMGGGVAVSSMGGFGHAGMGGGMSGGGMSGGGMSGGGFSHGGGHGR